MLLQTFESCHVKMTWMQQKASILFKISWVNFFGHPVFTLKTKMIPFRILGECSKFPLISKSFTPVVYP